METLLAIDKTHNYFTRVPKLWEKGGESRVMSDPFVFTVMQKWGDIYLSQTYVNPYSVLSGPTCSLIFVQFTGQNNGRLSYPMSAGDVNDVDLHHL